MAEVLAGAVAADPTLSFHSAGTHAVPNRPATATAVDVVAELGIDLSGHRAAPLDRAVDQQPDRVYVMTVAQQVEVLSRFPNLDDHLTLLDPTGIDVADPYGLDVRAYRTARDHVLEAVTARFG